jgi:hypothetical protein
MRMGASVSHDLAVISEPRGERTVRLLLSVGAMAALRL